MLQKFKMFYNSLNEADRKAIIEYLFNNELDNISEGYNTGPFGKIEKGLFTGAVGTAKRCPTCHRPI